MNVVVTVDVEYGDRPSPDPLGAMSQILDVLDESHAPATFFVQGRFALAHPALVAELAERDHTLGLHGHAHVDYRRLSDAGIRGEIRDGLNAIHAAAPRHEVAYTRLPYGFGTEEERITAVLDDFDLVPVGWDVSTFDWDNTFGEGQSVERALVARDLGGIVLFHSWPVRTPRILKHLITSTGPSGVASLADVALAGRHSTGRTIHLAAIDPVR